MAQARLLRVEAERVRLLLAVESEPSSRRLLAEQLEQVETRRFGLMAWIIAIPDDKVRLICIMRFLEGRSWETIARRFSRLGESDSESDDESARSRQLELLSAQERAMKLYKFILEERARLAGIQL